MLLDLLTSCSALLTWTFLYSSSPPIFQPSCAYVLGSWGESKHLSVFTDVAWSFAHIWNVVSIIFYSALMSPVIFAEALFSCGRGCWWAERRWPQAVGIETALWVEKSQLVQKAWTMPQKVPVSFAAALACKSLISLPSQAIILWPNLKSLSHNIQVTKFITDYKDFDQTIISST